MTISTKCVKRFSAYCSKGDRVDARCLCFVEEIWFERLTNGVHPAHYGILGEKLQTEQRKTDLAQTRREYFLPDKRKPNLTNMEIESVKIERKTDKRKDRKLSEAKPVHRKQRQQQIRSDKAEKATIGNATDRSKREIYYVPEEGIELILPYIKDFKTIWDPACGPMENYPLKDVLERHGHRVVTSDILMGREYDFFAYKTKKRHDMIVTTPPYSLRKEFVLRALELNKSFALFVPLNILESQTMKDLFKQYGVSLVFPPKTLTYFSPDDNKSVKSLPYSIWLVWGVSKMPPVVYM